MLDKFFFMVYNLHVKSKRATAQRRLKMRNHRTVNVKITRIELCKLILACDSIKFELEKENHSAQGWTELKEKLKQQLDAFDAKLDEEENK